MTLLTRIDAHGAAAEFRMNAPDGDDNLFDTRDIRMACVVTAPSGAKTEFLGFAYQPHEPEPKQNADAKPDIWRPTGELEFRCRFLPKELGKHTLSVQLAGVAAETGFQVSSLTSMPTVRMAPHGYAFQLDDGAPFYPIGSNVAWADATPEEPSQLKLLFAMMTRFAERGANVIRLWCNAQWGHVIDWTGNEYEDALRFGQLSMSGCAKLDAILAHAETIGMRIMFCIDAANNWNRDITRSPYHEANGGPCKCPRDYFDHPDARAMTREKMKYVAARWASSPAVWCWEFWNEVDGIGLDHVDQHQQLAWHEEMSRVLRAADPEDRIITTSTGHPLNLAALWQLPEMEFTQTHHYGYEDSVDQTPVVLKGYHEKALQLFGKAHMSTEIGTSFRGPGQERWETDGRVLHASLWGSVILPRACGAALFWWWQNYIYDHDNDTAFTGISGFLAEERWHETLSEVVDLRVEAALDAIDPPGPLKVPTTLSGRNFYRSTFTLDREGILEDSHLIPNTWYGSDWPDLQMRRTFLVDFPQAGTFTMKVWAGQSVCNDIASDDGATGTPEAEIRIDGVQVLRRPVKTTRPDGELYADLIAVDVPAGPHEIEAVNAGGGMFITGHLVLTPYQTSRRRLHGQGVRCGDRTCLWFLNLDWSWPAFQAARECEPIEDATAVLSGMAPGDYTIEWWNTVTGEVDTTDRVRADGNGVLRLGLPAIATDFAAKLIKETQ